MKWGRRKIIFCAVLWIGLLSLASLWVDRANYHAGFNFRFNLAGNHYDTINAFLATKNPAGFFPNRRGNPFATGYYGADGCDLVRKQSSPKTHTFWGSEVSLEAYNNDCIYTHYPGGGELVYGSLLGPHTALWSMRLLPLLMNLISMVLALLILEFSFGIRIASVAVVLFYSTVWTQGWMGELLYIPFQWLLLSGSWWLFLQYQRLKKKTFLLGSVLLFGLQLLFSLELFPSNLLVLGWLSRKESIRVRAWVFGTALVSVALYLAPRFASGVNLFELAKDRASQQITLERIQYSFGILGPWREVFFGKWITTIWFLFAIVALWDRPLRRVTCGMLLVLSVLFWLLFPSTCIAHNWLMWTHLAPFLIFSIAMVLERVEESHRRLARALVVVTLVSSLTLLTTYKFSDGWNFSKRTHNHLLLVAMVENGRQYFAPFEQLFDGKRGQAQTGPMTVLLFLQKKETRFSLAFRNATGTEMRVRQFCSVDTWHDQSQWTLSTLSWNLAGLESLTDQEGTDLVKLRCDFPPQSPVSEMEIWREES